MSVRRLLYTAVDDMVTGDMAEMLGVPDIIHNVARAMGHPQSIPECVQTNKDLQGSYFMLFYYFCGALMCVHQGLIVYLL